MSHGTNGWRRTAAWAVVLCAGTAASAQFAPAAPKGGPQPFSDQLLSPAQIEAQNRAAGLEPVTISLPTGEKFTRWVPKTEGGTSPTVPNGNKKQPKWRLVIPATLGTNSDKGDKQDGFGEQDNGPNDDPDDGGGDGDAEHGNRNDDPDEYGLQFNFEWTEPRAAVDSIVIYVSSSEGNDSNSGLSPERPVKTFARAKSLMRHGFPDWMLLKRGDVFTEGLGHWKMSGRSESEPMVISSYGEASARPLLKCDQGISTSGGGGSPARIENVWVLGLDFHSTRRDPDSPEFVGGEVSGTGVVWLRPGKNVLFEDCAFRYYWTGMVFQGEDTGIDNLRVRGCVVTDSYGLVGVGHSSGMYVVNVHGVTIEGCLFDHNGWNERVPGAERTIFNHNLYIDDREANYGWTSGVVIRDNIIARGSSHGIQLRPGGIVTGNIFHGNAIAMFVARSASEVTGNVVMAGTDISPSLPRGWGIEVLQCENAVVRDNIVCHKGTGVGAGEAFRVVTSRDYEDVPSFNVELRGNIVYDWNGPSLGTNSNRYTSFTIASNIFQDLTNGQPMLVLNSSAADSNISLEGNCYHTTAPEARWFNQYFPPVTFSYESWVDRQGERNADREVVSFPDPYRTLGSYHSWLGHSADERDFFAEARTQGRRSWRGEYSALAFNKHIRAGFDLSNQGGER